MKKLTLFLFLITVFTLSVFPQNPQWIIYDTSNSSLPCNGVSSIAIDGNGVKWIGTCDGLAAFDGANWAVYNTSNSDLPSDVVNCIAIDSSGIKWIGTSLGLAAFDGTNFTVYNTSNSDLPSNMVNCIAIDNSGIKWIGTCDGLAAFDGTNWSVYNTSNSDLPHNNVDCIAIDGNGIKWISSGGFVTAFDGINWMVCSSSLCLVVLAIDHNETKWIGKCDTLAALNDTNWTFYTITSFIHLVAAEENGMIWISAHSTTNPSMGNGLTSFNGTDWINYNVGNSDLPDNYVVSIAFDENGTKWIGTREGGLAAFNENGIPTTGVEDNASSYGHANLYPNPVKDYVYVDLPGNEEISFIQIFNIQGSLIKDNSEPNSQKRIDVRDLPEGFYILKIYTENGFMIGKIVKQ